MNKYFVSVGQTTGQMNTKEDSNLSLHKIIKMFEKHKSIFNIIKNLKHKGPFEFQPTTKKILKEIILKLDQKTYGFIQSL